MLCQILPSSLLLIHGQTMSIETIVVDICFHKNDVIHIEMMQTLFNAVIASRPRSRLKPQQANGVLTRRIHEQYEKTRKRGIVMREGKHSNKMSASTNCNV
jgi:hypothetical protein